MSVAGAVERLRLLDAEAATSLTPKQVRRPGRSRGTSSCRVGADAGTRGAARHEERRHRGRSHSSAPPVRRRDHPRRLRIQLPK
jgi:hypothetical protein